MLTKVFKTTVKTTVFTMSLFSSTIFAEDVIKKDLIKEYGVISEIVKSGISSGNNNNKNTDANTNANTKEVNSENTPQINAAINTTNNPAETPISISELRVTNVIDENNTNNLKKTESAKKTEEAETIIEKINGTLSSEEPNIPGNTGHKTKKSKERTSASKGNTKNPNPRDSVKEVSFADNEQINVVLSNRDINRVLVKGDKIQSVNGPAGLYTAKNDAAGSAYFGLYGETTFTIFASTVKGHNFSLLITPKTIPGRTVILEPTTPSLLTARFEEAESYQKALVTLISSMINNEALEDYSYSDAKKTQRKQKTEKSEKNEKNDFYGIADIQQIASYSGSHFSHFSLFSHLLGVVSEITNKTKKPITLKPSYFYKSGVRAVALSRQTIAPAETGLLYQIISEE
ncbi:MAG: IncF plasmid conjugative transfer pilus assembly protein TraK [uncultured bacterium]|nr:MAG: IncF plasmid conjugative transfer pilus assembly protein TraK [uncultured bacterium]